MKALSVRQPWASLILSGRKSIEIRSRPTKHRGALAIHASLKPEKKAPWDLLDKEAPLGHLIGTVKLTECRPMWPGDTSESLVEYQDGLFAWVLEDPAALPSPIKIKGRLGLFDVSLP